MLRLLHRTPLPVASARRRRWPTARVRFTFDDGGSVDLALIWPGGGDPVTLIELWWDDRLGWIAHVEDHRQEVHTWYGWRLRVR